MILEYFNPYDSKMVFEADIFGMKQAQARATQLMAQYAWLNEIHIYEFRRTFKRPKVKKS